MAKNNEQKKAANVEAAARRLAERRRIDARIASVRGEALRRGLSPVDILREQDAEAAVQVACEDAVLVQAGIGKVLARRAAAVLKRGTPATACEVRDFIANWSRTVSKDVAEVAHAIFSSTDF